MILKNGKINWKEEIGRVTLTPGVIGQPDPTVMMICKCHMASLSHNELICGNSHMLVQETLQLMSSFLLSTV